MCGNLISYPTEQFSKLIFVSAVEKSDILERSFSKRVEMKATFSPQQDGRMNTADVRANWEEVKYMCLYSTYKASHIINMINILYKERSKAGGY